MSALRGKADGDQRPSERLLLAEGVEQLGTEGEFDVRFCKERTFCFRLGLVPRRFFDLGAIGSDFECISQAIIGCGGGMAASLTNRLRFCTVAVSRNSSLAPERPRNRSLVRARLCFASPNRVSIFLRRVLDWP